jgi:hypothetical protein
MVGIICYEFVLPKQPSILLSGSGLLMAAHSLDKTEFLLHHDNVPSNTVLLVKQIPMFEHPPYFPDFTPCDFYHVSRTVESLFLNNLKTLTAVLLKGLSVMIYSVKSLTQKLEHVYKFRKQVLGGDHTH